MKAAGMPKEAIAEKIAYEAGGKGTAKRIVDALVDEPVKLKSKPKILSNNANKGKKTVNQKQQKKTTPKQPVKPPQQQANRNKNSNNKKNFGKGFRNEL